MKNGFEYDKTNPSSIEAYAQKMVNRSFRDILEADNRNNSVSKYENQKKKGGMGNLVEEHFFHYKPNSDSNPDFLEAGVELKVSPYKINKNKSISAKERLVITMIDYKSLPNETFETSHLMHKANLMLLVYYLYNEQADSSLDYVVKYAKLFSVPKEDLAIIKNDYETIQKMINEGRAHELSEGLTMYLGACTKSSDSSKRTKQPYSQELAKPRAFALKQSYMTYVLNNYIIPNKKTYDPIVKEDFQPESFEDYVMNCINKEKGKTFDELSVKYGLDTKAKNAQALLALRILDVKSNKAQEFEKAGIVLKAIRIEANDTIEQHMSFPAFKFNELITETWENSEFGNYLKETRFLFVVYKYDEKGTLRLKGCQFWSIPISDLENGVRETWEKTVTTIKEGVQIKKTKKGRTNNLPKTTFNGVCHVRPHGRDGKDIDILPNGDYLTKQSFWLNNTYIYSQIKDELK